MKKIQIQVDSLQALREQVLLQGLDDSLLLQLQNLVRFQYVPLRQLALRQGTEGDSLLLVVSGQLQVVAFSEDGREVGMSCIGAGDFHGEVAVIDGLPRQASALALSEDTVVGYLPRVTALELMSRHPLVAQRIQRRLCHTIREGARLRAALSAASANARIFAVLQHTLSQSLAASATGAAGQGANPLGTVVIAHMPSQQALATMANVSRESVSRALQLLIRQGIVAKDRRRLIVHEPQRLERLAAADH